MIFYYETKPLEIYREQFPPVWLIVFANIYCLFNKNVNMNYVYKFLYLQNDKQHLNLNFILKLLTNEKRLIIFTFISAFDYILWSLLFLVVTVQTRKKQKETKQNLEYYANNQIYINSSKIHICRLYTLSPYKTGDLLKEVHLVWHI